MNRRQIGLKLVLDELGIDSSMNSFDDRLVLQKSIYLAQELGVHLGYHFSWYIKGPYSKDLTADAFANLTGSVDGWVLDDRTKAKLLKAKQLAEALRTSHDAAREFEKLASVLFVYKTGQATETDKITACMRNAGKNFDVNDVANAIQQLRDYDLIA